MKFKNFVKSLASSGVIYNRGVEELPLADRWLASPTAMMLIPPSVRSVTAAAIQEMPQGISKMLDQIGHTDYAVLSEAMYETVKELKERISLIAKEVFS